MPANPAKSLTSSILREWKAEKLKPGVQRMFVYIYAPPDTQFTEAMVNGAAVAVNPSRTKTIPSPGCGWR